MRYNALCAVNNYVVRVENWNLLVTLWICCVQIICFQISWGMKDSRRGLSITHSRRVTKINFRTWWFDLTSSITLEDIQNIDQQKHFMYSVFVIKLTSSFQNYAHPYNWNLRCITFTPRKTSNLVFTFKQTYKLIFSSDHLITSDHFDDMAKIFIKNYFLQT